MPILMNLFAVPFAVGALAVAYVVNRAIFKSGVTPPMLLAPVAASFFWWLAFIHIQKAVCWPFWHDEGFATAFGRRYGGDKSLANFVFELPIVLVGSAVLFVIAKFAFRRQHALAVAQIVAVLTPLLVVLAIPAYGE